MNRISSFFLLSLLLPSLSLGFDSSNAFRSLISFPNEIRLATDIVPDVSGLIQLDEVRITQLKDMYAKNFALRNKLSYGSYAIQGVLLAIGLHELGAFDFLFSTIKPLPITDTKDIATRLALVEKSIEQIRKTVNAKSTSTTLGWAWSGIKYVSGLVTFALVASKLMQIKNYIDAKPNFVWFFTKYTITDRVEIFKRSMKKLIEARTAGDYSTDYYRKVIVPELQAIANNLELLIAFMDYYFDGIDRETLSEQGLDLQVRYLFNTTNDFFKKMHRALQDINPDPSTLALIDDYKIDLMTIIKKCQFFERDFLVVAD